MEEMILGGNNQEKNPKNSEASGKKGFKNKGSGKSIIATARKMAEIVWAMLSDNKILIQVK